MRLASLVGSAAVDNEPYALLAKCIPENNTFSGPLNPVLELVAGAFGGIMFEAAVTMIIIFALVGIFLAKSDRAQGWIKAIGMVVVILLGVMIVLLVISGVATAIDGQCGNVFAMSTLA